MAKRTRWSHVLLRVGGADPDRSTIRPTAYQQGVGWILGLSLAGLVLFGSGLYERLRLSVMQRRLDRQLAELAAEHERLTQERERLQSDSTYVEGLIRSTFKLAKPGELVIPLDAPSSDGERRQQTF